MRILIDISHPAHVHFFYNIYSILKERHEFYFTCRNVPIIKHLLNFYKIQYYVLGEKGQRILDKFKRQFYFTKELHNIIKEKKIDIACGVSTIYSTIGTKAKCIAFCDDDRSVVKLLSKFVLPYADCVLSPEALRYESNRNVIYYPGYHELSYLHPNYFTPDPNILTSYGLNEENKYFILRFNAFKAHHDIHEYGLNKEQKHILIDILSKYGKVFITTETELDSEFAEFRMPIAPDEIHTFLYYAQMLISDSQTMTIEAAVLGVPSFRCNTFANRLAVLEELELKYGLTFGYHPSHFDWMLYRIKEFLELSNLKEEWQKKRERILQDKIDVTEFLVWFVENYPESVKEVKAKDFDFGRFK